MKFNLFPSKKSAFTLVELLVVITIIGILVGVALPVFQKAQEKGKAVSCMSNLRQLGLGLQAYKSDNDNFIFDAADPDGKNWPEQLYPTYISSWKSFKSPFDRRTPSEVTTSAPVSYGFNNLDPSLLGASSSKINFPTNLILFMPAIDMSVGGDPSFVVTNVGNVNAFVTPPTVANRGTHASRGRANALFADGHAEDVLWSKLMDASTPEGLKRWVYNTPP